MADNDKTPNDPVLVEGPCDYCGTHAIMSLGTSEGGCCCDDCEVRLLDHGLDVFPLSPHAMEEN